MRILLVLLMFSLIGCAAYKPKKIVFYKDGKPVKTFISKGIFSADEFFGNYKIWAESGWEYYQYTCVNCTHTEQEIVK